MELKLLQKEKDGRVRFMAKGTTPTMLNTYRRLIVNKVPAMAIDTLELVENSSALYDEMIAQRMGLIVLKTDKESYFLREKCKCKGAGCARCTVTLTLEAEGPGIVTADMLKSADPKIVPAYGKTPIVILLEGQRLKLIATASLGTGKEHIKYSPGLMFYSKFPHADAKKKKEIEKVTNECPIDKGKNHEAWQLCMGCQGMLEEMEVITSNNTDFIVTIEPWGQLSAAEIVESAVDVLDEQLEELTAEIKKVK